MASALILMTSSVQIEVLNSMEAIIGVSEIIRLIMEAVSNIIKFQLEITIQAQ